MESNRKSRGFMKGKLVMSIYKAAKPSSTVPHSSKVKQSPLQPSAAGGFIVNQEHIVTQAKQKVAHHPHHVEFIVNQEQVVPQPSQKVSFLLPADSGRDSYGIIHDNLDSVAVDESVNMKASTYISSVRERIFGLHRVNSEHKKL